MPRKKEMTEAELLAERDRIESQLRAVREKENTELGKAVKRIFGKRLPDDQKGRMKFLEGLRDMFDEKLKGAQAVSDADADETPSVVTAVSENAPQNTASDGE